MLELRGVVGGRRGAGSHNSCGVMETSRHKDTTQDLATDRSMKFNPYVRSRDSKGKRSELRADCKRNNVVNVPANGGRPSRDCGNSLTQRLEDLPPSKYCRLDNARKFVRDAARECRTDQSGIVMPSAASFLVGSDYDVGQSDRHKNGTTITPCKRRFDDSDDICTDSHPNNKTHRRLQGLQATPSLRFCESGTPNGGARPRTSRSSTRSTILSDGS